MSTITVRDAKIEDAARILEIYAYYDYFLLGTL